MWMSCRCPGEKSENSDLVKNGSGQLQGQDGGRFTVTQQNPVSEEINSPPSTGNDLNSPYNVDEAVLFLVGYGLQLRITEVLENFATLIF